MCTRGLTQNVDETLLISARKVSAVQSVTELFKRHLGFLEIHIRRLPQVRNEYEDFRCELRHRVQPLVRPLLVAGPSLVGRGEPTSHGANVLNERSDLIRALPGILCSSCARLLFQKRAFEDGHGPQGRSSDRGIRVRGQTLESTAYG